MQVLGAEAAVAGEALVGTPSAAHAPLAAPAAAARIVTARMPSLMMADPYPYRSS